jgi:hypothetical protein
MARPRTDNTEGFGSDSFLDIVCNMVGIIILLVLVVGLRIKEAPLSLAAEVEPTPTVAAAAPSGPTPIVQALQQRIAQQQSALAGAAQGRQVLEQRLATSRAAAAKQDEEIRRLGKHGAAAQQQADLEKALLAKQQELRSLMAAVQAVPDAKPAKVTQLEAYPAPFVKKVVGKEAHFRILGGRVVYVPLEELEKRAALDAHAKMRLSPGEVEFEALVGPVHGFNASYRVRRGNGLLDYRLTFIPLSDQMGETVAEALAPSSLFRRILASQDPTSTTITFWTYQDSFEAFRELRKEVYLLGFNVANWPMKLGKLIQAAKHGRHSETQ